MATRWSGMTWMGLGVGLAASVLVIAAAVRVSAHRAAPEVPPLTGVFEGNDTYRTQLPVRLVTVSPHLPVATDIQPVPGHPEDLAVLQKGGVAVLLDVEGRRWRSWFELEVNGASEMGLIGLAFAPDFEQTGVFYVHHNPIEGDRNLVTRFTCNPRTLREVTRGPDILEVPQPYRNHNGGQLAFGPDGYLYVALGDGGSAFDPEGHGQNGATLLGSILRIEPGEQGGYTVPPDNPFVGDPDVHDAIFALGLRNPWRFSFDDAGRLIAADVGQNTFEEVNLVPPGGNLGWSHSEGEACLRPPCGEDAVDPIWVYGRQDGMSVTGGYVSRDPTLPELAGRYVFGDFVTGRLWAMQLPDGPGKRADEPIALGRFPVKPSTFGRDAAGRLYVADFEGSIHRIER